MPSSAALLRTMRLGQRRLTSQTRSSQRGPLLVDVHDGGRRKSVEPGRRSIAIGADVFRIDQIIDLKVRQLLGLRDGIHTVAGLSEHGADFRFPPLERLQVQIGRGLSVDRTRRTRSPCETGRGAADGLDGAGRA